MATNDRGPDVEFSAWRHEQMRIKLRDWFAGQAIQGMLASGVDLDIDKGIIGLTRAQTAYAIADAMLAARE